MANTDPFTGIWKFRPGLSRLSTAAPRSWVQRIRVSGDEVSVQEQIMRPDGAEMLVTPEATFDGKEYAVHGSPVGDTIAHTRVDSHSISGMESKNGESSVRETVTAAQDGRTLTQRCSMFKEGREIANGVAVFEKIEE